VAATASQTTKVPRTARLASPTPITCSRSPALCGSLDDRPEQQAQAGNRQQPAADRAVRPPGSSSRHQHQGCHEPDNDDRTLTRKTEPHQKFCEQQAPGDRPIACRGRWSGPGTDARARSVGSRKTSLISTNDAGDRQRCTHPMTARHRSTGPPSSRSRHRSMLRQRRQTDEEEALPAEPIGQAATDEQQSCEDHRVRATSTGVRWSWRSAAVRGGQRHVEECVSTLTTRAEHKPPPTWPHVCHRCSPCDVRLVASASSQLQEYRRKNRQSRRLLRRLASRPVLNRSAPSARRAAG